MKTILFPALAFLFSFQLIAQLTIDPSWIKTESSAFGTAEAWGVEVDEDGTVYWTANSNDLNQGLDIKCFKLSPSGEELWDSPFRYGGLGTQQAYVLNSDATSLYIGGRFCLGLVNTCDMLLVKVDKDAGALTWDQTLNFSGNGYEEIDGLELRPDGIYCGGWAQELQSEPFQSDIGLWKLDYSGNTLWSNHFGQMNSAEHQDGHFVVDDNHIFAAGLWNGTGIGNLYNGHAFLGKFSLDDGSFVDSTLFGQQTNAPFDIENALGMTSDGEFLYVTGYATPLSVDDWQIFVAKYDKDLNQIWYTDWGGTGAESARGIVVDDGVIYVAGLTASAELLTGGERDGVLLKLDLDGNLMEYLTWGDDQENAFHDLQVDNNNIYLSGTTELDTMGANKRAFLLAYEDVSTAAEEPSTPADGPSFSVYPNPANGSVNITLDQPGQQRKPIIVLDATGHVLWCGTIENSTLELDGLPLGNFLINVNFGPYSVSRKVINQR